MKITLDLSEKDIKAIKFLSLNLCDAVHMVLDEYYSKEEATQWDDCMTFIDNLDETIRRAENIRKNGVDVILKNGSSWHNWHLFDTNNL